MKRYLFLLVGIFIILILLSGCRSYDDSNLAEGTENTVIETGSIPPAESTNWETTKHETVNNFSGVTMTVKEGTAISTGLTVVFKNNTSNQVIYGEYFLLEKKINGKWYQVPIALEPFPDIGYSLSSGDETEWKVDWDWRYGSLDTGVYRIVKDISDFRGTGDFDIYYLASEFTIY